MKPAEITQLARLLSLRQLEVERLQQESQAKQQRQQRLQHNLDRLAQIQAALPVMETSPLLVQNLHAYRGHLRCLENVQQLDLTLAEKESAQLRQQLLQAARHREVIARHHAAVVQVWQGTQDRREQCSLDEMGAQAWLRQHGSTYPSKQERKI